MLILLLIALFFFFLDFNLIFRDRHRDTERDDVCACAHGHVSWKEGQKESQGAQLSNAHQEVKHSGFL